MRIRVSRAQMIEQARRTGYLAGKSLRKGAGTHHDHWCRYCIDHGIAFVGLSQGRQHAAVEFDLSSIRPGLAFWDAAPLYRDLLGAIERVRQQADPPTRVIQRDGVRSLEVRGLTLAEGKWLSRQFADIVGRYHRDIVGVPANVTSLQEERRKRALRGIA